MEAADVYAGTEWRLLSPLTLWAVAVPWLLGAASLAGLGLRRRGDALAFLGWAWVAGTFVVGLAFLGWLGAGLPVRGFVILPQALLLPALWLLVRSRRAPAREPEAARAAAAGPEGTRVGRLMFASAFALVLVLACDRIVLGSVFHVSIADEAVIWAAKAKALFVNDGFGGDLATPAWTGPRMMHADYPLLNPLLQLWVFGLAGGIVHAVNRLPIQVFVPALALVLAGALRLRARPSLAAVLLLLLMTSEPMPEMTARALSDVMVALGFALALDAFARFRRTGEAHWWKLCVVALAFLAWSKNEGLMLVLAVAVPALLSLRWQGAVPAARRPRPSEWAWLVLPVVVVAVQWAVNARHGFRNDLVEGGMLAAAWPRVGAELPERVATLWEHLSTVIVRDPGGGHLLLAMFLGLALLFPRRLLMRCEWVTAWAVILGLLGYVLVYLGTPQELDWHLGTSLRRILFHLTPAAVMWTAAAAEELISPTLRSGEQPN
ncbi:MAG: hypothetical protein ACYTG2_07180 [Planctomycetota bacterium]|jgi:hypothetical protein